MLTEVVLIVASLAASSVNTWDKRRTSMSSLASSALRALRKLDWTFMLNDNEVGFCAMRRHVVVEAHVEVLSRTIYEEIFAWSIDQHRLLREYRAICKMICDVEEDPALFHLQCRSWRNGNFVASLNTLIKSHKAPG